MKQPHSEDNIEHTDGEQDTGNHKTPDAVDAGGADRFGGTRAGSQNVENAAPDATDGVVDQEGPQAERSPEKDEFGRL